MNPKAHSFILDGNAVEVFEGIIVVFEGVNLAVIIIFVFSKCRITAFSSPFSIKFVVFKRDNLRGGRSKSEELIVSFHLFSCSHAVPRWLVARRLFPVFPSVGRTALPNKWRWKEPCCGSSFWPCIYLRGESRCWSSSSKRHCSH